MSTPESKVRDPVVKWAKGNGFLHFRMSFRIGVAQGVPDDLFISPAGIHVWIEFKRPDGTPTPLQKDKLAKLAVRGVPAMWFDNVDEAKGFLQTVLDFGKVAAGAR